MDFKFCVFWAFFFIFLEFPMPQMYHRLLRVIELGMTEKGSPQRKAIKEKVSENCYEVEISNQDYRCTRFFQFAFEQLTQKGVSKAS